MRPAPLAILLLVLLSSLALSGCMQQAPGSVPTTVMSPGTPAPASVPATATATVAASPVVTTPVTGTPAPVSPYPYSPTPSPTDAVPQDDSVAIQVNRDPIAEDPAITVVYDGGMSLGSVNEMDVTVVRSDGVVENKAVYTPVMGSSVTLMGTPASDRVIVWVTMLSGKTYKVYDAYSSYGGLY